MTTAERTAIAAPAEGLRVYDTDTKDFWFFDGTVWIQESANASTEWEDDGTGGIRAVQAKVAGNDVIISDAGNFGIGTTNPTAKLQVVGSVDRITARFNQLAIDSEAAQGLINFTAGARIKDDGTGYIYNNGRGASRISLNDDGIDFYLDEVGASPAADGEVTWDDNTSIFSIYNGGVVPNATLKTELRFETDNDGDSASLSDLNGGLALSSVTGAATNPELFIATGGNVGIGTATPDAELTVINKTGNGVGIRLDSRAASGGQQITGIIEVDADEQAWLALRSELRDNTADSRGDIIVRDNLLRILGPGDAMQIFLF